MPTEYFCFDCGNVVPVPNGVHPETYPCPWCGVELGLLPKRMAPAPIVPDTDTTMTVSQMAEQFDRLAQIVADSMTPPIEVMEGDTD